jgi:hypothetical protein
MLIARGLNLCRSCGPHFKTLSTQPLHKYLAVIVHTGLLGAFEYFMDEIIIIISNVAMAAVTVASDKLRCKWQSGSCCSHIIIISAPNRK